MLHVSSHWYLSAQHAASVSMLLSICFWLTACLYEQSKRCRVSLNKLMGSFIFGVPLFFFFFLAISENTVVWCLLKSCTQLALDFRNNILTLNSKGGSLTNSCSSLIINNSTRFYSCNQRCGVKTHFSEQVLHTCHVTMVSLVQVWQRTLSHVVPRLSLFPCLPSLAIVKISNKGKITLKK